MEQIRDKNLYYVGGYVRDEILGVKCFDIDFCYEGDAIDFAQKFNIIKTNKDFGTVRILLNNKEIDIASTRTEVYPKAGHLPVIKETACSLEKDLQRRDFTINAIAKNTVTNELVDYFGGLEDIKNKKLRVLHSKSFVDDPTRIVRGLKFSVRFNFELEEETKRLQEEYLDNINYDMSYHRLKKELVETFNLNIEDAYNKFVEQGIYKLLGENQIIPEIKCSIQDLIDKFNPQYRWLVYLGLYDLSNFELNKEEAAILNSYHKIKSIKPKDNVETYFLFNKAPLESVLLYAISINYDIATNYLENLKNLKPFVNGDDLLALGVPKGVAYKDILEKLLIEKIKNPNMTKVEEIELVKSQLLNGFLK
ncbi:CCA tRNA nucleotidyltransferase [bacterium]|nr:CCA tRNA nucleotidyltransferase [bacterium]